MGAPRVTPLGAVVRGAIAGAVGTLAMDLVWYRRYRKGGGDDSFLDWELSRDVKSYDDASEPAQVGKRIAEAVFDIELPEESAGLMNDAMHWATGTGWGTVYGVVAGSTRTANPVVGALIGPTAWATSYLVLGLAKLYKPIWEYDAKTLLRDLTAHLAFGLGTASAFRALRR